MRQGALSRILVALCVTEIVSYGALYYAFAVLAPTIAKDTSWSTLAVTAAFSVGSLAGAVCGIPVGRMLQRHGPRPVMAIGSIIGAGAVGLVAVATDLPTFFLAWLLVGIATSGLYYAPAFAALTGWFGPRRVAAITTLTLAAGFASTIFAPFTNLLDAQLGWRGAYLVLAGIVLVVTLPAHAFALREPWPRQERVAVGHDREILTSRPFVLLTAAGTLTSLVSYASLVALPLLLIGRGTSPALAAWAVGLSGAGQVLGRLIYPRLNRTTSPRTRTAAVIALLAAGVGIQSLVTGPVWLLFLIAIVTGAARGLFTLVNATFVADLWGPERYASVSGVYNAPVSAAGALAPGIGAAVAATMGGYPALFAVLCAVAVAAALIAAAARAPRISASGAGVNTELVRET